MAPTHVFRLCLLLGVLHTIDELVLSGSPGVPASRHLGGLLLTLCLAALAVLLFPRTTWTVQTGLALVPGALLTLDGVLHGVHVTVGGPSTSDVTGIVAGGAGTALLVLGALITWRSRPSALSRRRRWATRLVAASAGAAVLLGVAVPVGTAFVQTHAPRHDIGAAPGPQYESVTFRADDGLLLSGWYVPSRNRAAVVLVHGGGSDRTGTLGQAVRLAASGYGVLLYDARGRGRSEGSPNGYGWDWARDVAGALDFLGRRPDVDPSRIGGLGLSTGASVLLEVAATDRRLAAVVAEGAAGRSYADRLSTSRFSLLRAYLWTAYTASQAFSGSSPGRPLLDLVPGIAPTPLLLVAGARAPHEPEFGRAYARAAGPTAELWVVPGGGHTSALRERPQEYERRVTELFDRALLRT